MEGQVASPKFSLARLSDPQLYYVLAESEFTFDSNNSKVTKSSIWETVPQKSKVYCGVLSLYIFQIAKLINQKGKLEFRLVFDEFPTFHFNEIHIIITARSNKLATCLDVED